MSGLEQEFSGKVTAKVIDATSPASVKAVQELGFGKHGLVIRNKAGEALFKQADHDVKIDDVRKKLTEILGD